MLVLVSHSIQSDNKPSAGVTDMYTFMQVTCEELQHERKFFLFKYV